MDDLITRIENASEGSRELDAEIAVASKSVPKGAWLLGEGMPPATFATGAHEYWDCPHYTTSIDAALSLLPEGWLWRLWVLPDGMAGRAEIAPTLDIMTEEGGYYSHAATPALALCAAILKARNV